MKVRLFGPLLAVIVLSALVGLACASFTQPTMVMATSTSTTVPPTKKATTAATNAPAGLYNFHYAQDGGGLWHLEVKEFKGEYLDQGRKTFGEKASQVNLPPGKIARHRFQMNENGTLHFYAYPDTGDIYVFVYLMETKAQQALQIPPGQGVDLIQFPGGEYEAMIFAYGFGGMHYALAADANADMSVPLPVTPTPQP